MQLHTLPLPLPLLFAPLFLLTLTHLSLAQNLSRPSNTSICDYYTTALLHDNNSTNQKTLLTLLVNTAVIGNYSPINVGVTVPGILNKGTYNGTSVNLLPYFDGGLASTNNDASGSAEAGIVKNFLDDGGATPLLLNMPANGTSSNQYTLLTHLYSYFGALLGCSQIATPGFPAYTGDASMYHTHRFMTLDAYQVGYFITQVGLSAVSFGVGSDDVEAVGMALQGLFGVKCGAPTEVVKGQGEELQSVCIADNCPLAAPANCNAYEAVVQPSVANGTNANSTSMGNSTMTNGTGTVTSPPMGTASSSSAATNASKSGSSRMSVGIAPWSGLVVAFVGAAIAAFTL